jgi:hypothetical protein
MTKPLTNTPSTSPAAKFVDPILLNRVCGEYLEMPGLQLTLAQACRLWNTDPATGLGALEALVTSAFLRRSGLSYVRADSGRRCA